jgi:serine/threonine protein kinase
MAKYSQTGNKELEMQSRVTIQEQLTGPQSHVLRLLNSFEETGPNGQHLCLVHKPMAVTVASGIDSLPQYQNSRRIAGETRRYPKWMVKRILRHTLLGLIQLHALGIVHGDLQPGNLLFEVHDLDEAPEDDLKQNMEKTTGKITRHDGKQDKWAPPYLAVGQNLSRYADFGGSFNIQISDLGAGT